MESKIWKENNTLRENSSWKRIVSNNGSEQCKYEANDIITLRINKYSSGVYKGFIERTKYMPDHIAETSEYGSFEECREALLDLVKEMCSGFDNL